VLTGHQGGVWGVAFSADGDTLASAGEDGSVRLWDRHTGAARRTMLISDEGYAVIEGNTICLAIGDSWRRLGWQAGPEIGLDGLPEILPLEIFGELPRA
jgi:WD40 repeat protein